MAKKTRLQRTTEILRKHELIYQKVEYWHSFARKRIDLFGIIDILVLDCHRTIGLQICGSDLASHKQKMIESNNTIPWIEAGNELQIHSWRRLVKVRGKKAKYWDCRKVDVLLINNQLVFEERK